MQKEIFIQNELTVENNEPISQKLFVSNEEEKNDE